MDISGSFTHRAQGLVRHCWNRQKLGRGSLVGCCLWGRTESDTTEATQQQQPSSADAGVSEGPDMLQNSPFYVFVTVDLDSLLTQNNSTALQASLCLGPQTAEFPVFFFVNSSVSTVVFTLFSTGVLTANYVLEVDTSSAHMHLSEGVDTVSHPFSFKGRAGVILSLFHCSLGICAFLPSCSLPPWILIRSSKRDLISSYPSFCIPHYYDTVRPLWHDHGPS